MRRRILTLCASLAFLAPGMAEEDQRPRRPDVRGDGLLRIDGSMFDLAARSGGDFFFWAPGEFAAHAAAGPLVGLEDEDIALRYGALAPGERLEIAVPVDSGVGRIRFFAGIQKKLTITLTTPDGRPVTPREGTDRLETGYMLIASVSRPARGLWTLAISGEGRYVATARAREAGEEMVTLLDFDFVRRGGRPGHEGWFPLDRVPAASAEAVCKVTLGGALGSAAVSFEDSRGRPVGDLRLARDPEASPVDWLGPCRVPRTPFRVVARGRDLVGQAYQRITPALLVPGGR